MPTMKCPKCSNELFEIEHSLVALDCCSGCNGLWFDRGELEKIASLESALSKLGDPAESALTCPRCATSLYQHSTDATIGVNVDRCRDCGGLWLDRGELDAFRQRERPKRAHPDRKRAARPRPPDKLSLKELLLRFIDSSIDELR